jgi:hypothetical protein
MQKNVTPDKSSKPRSNLSKSVDTSLSLFNSSEKKPNKISLTDSPGPGQYSLPSSQSGPKFSLYGKLREKSYTVSPGPGTYILPRSRVVCTKFSPVRIKPTLEGWEKLGPGTYTPLLTSTGPKWGFGGSRRSKFQTNESPGPGSYNIPSLSSTKAFSLYPKRHEPLIKKSPGPGSYEPRLLETSLKFSFYPKIPSSIKQVTPGPGTYSPHLKLQYQIPSSLPRGPLSRFRRSP